MATVSWSRISRTGKVLLVPRPSFSASVIGFGDEEDGRVRGGSEIEIPLVLHPLVVALFNDGKILFVIDIKRRTTEMGVGNLHTRAQRITDPF